MYTSVPATATGPANVHVACADIAAAMIKQLVPIPTNESVNSGFRPIRSSAWPLISVPNRLMAHTATDAATAFCTPAASNIALEK